MNGWIKLNRKIFENWIWSDSEPFDKRSAWVDLLLLANHKDQKILHNGTETELKRGDVNRSLLQLSRRWGWSRGKTRRFIDALESAKMVSRNSTTDGTTLTIVNYSLYQDGRPTNETRVGTTDGTRVGTTVSQPADIYKNNKKLKEKKERKNYIQPGGTTSIREIIKAKSKGEKR